jgi:tripartite-type tricarboxylate transporter receptor subunit TctC
MKQMFIAALAALGTNLLLPNTGFAQATGIPADKAIILYVGYAPGGGYDGYARLIARNMGRLFPVSTCVPDLRL